jgi:hypothetical protein
LGLPEGVTGLPVKLYVRVPVVIEVVHAFAASTDMEMGWMGRQVVVQLHFDGVPGTAAEL